AVAPVVEVRDHNDQPMAGVLVRFAIRNGHATFNGARNLSVVTNAAGRAAATGLVPTGNGALQIGATAAFQGQTAAVTIAQTNVMTPAQAAAVSGAPVRRVAREPALVRAQAAPEAALVAASRPRRLASSAAQPQPAPRSLSRSSEAGPVPRNTPVN